MNIPYVAKRILQRAIDLAPRGPRLRLRTAYGMRYSLDPEMVGLSDWQPADRRSCALDVGANNGVTSCALARMFEQVHAFEPNGEVLKEWEDVAPGNVTIWNCALSNQAGSGELKVPFNERHRFSGLGSLEQLEGEAYKALHRETVELKPLDGLLPPEQRIDFMKIDVEGHELSTLRGAVGVLKRDRPTIAIEVWPENRSVIHEFFLQIGYGLVPIQDIIGKAPAEQNLCYGPMEYWNSDKAKTRKPA